MLLTGVYGPCRGFVDGEEMNFSWSKPVVEMCNSNILEVGGGAAAAGISGSGGAIVAVTASEGVIGGGPGVLRRR